MKSTKELDHLKKLVSDSLIQNGTLGKIKAELRASVFSVINANKNSEIQLKNHDENIKKINAIKNMDGGIKMLELICDFLNYYGMTYTKSVLLAEASLPENTKHENNATEEPALYTLFRSKFKSDVDSSIGNSTENDNIKVDRNIDLIDKIAQSTNSILNDRKKEIIIDDDDDKSDDSNSDSLIFDAELLTSDCSLTSENLSKYDYYEVPELKENLKK